MRLFRENFRMNAMAAAHTGDDLRPQGAILGRLELVCDISGALWLPRERALLVADLHLEKGASFVPFGQMLPPYDTAATLARLAGAVARFKPRLVVAMGDSFHRRDSARSLGAETRGQIAALQAGRDWLWITGNHDPDKPHGLGGEGAQTLVLGGVMLRHAPDAMATGPEIAGHMHPVAKVRLRGRSLRRRCFALSGGRCILPAMGAYAGGLNLRDKAFSPLFPHGVSARMMGDTRVFSVSERLLLPDQA
mgnify:CR=1 FL=1